MRIIKFLMIFAIIFLCSGENAFAVTGKININLYTKNDGVSTKRSDITPDVYAYSSDFSNGYWHHGETRITYEFSWLKRDVSGRLFIKKKLSDGRYAILSASATGKLNTTLLAYSNPDEKPGYYKSLNIQFDNTTETLNLYYQEKAKITQSYFSKTENKTIKTQETSDWITLGTQKTLTAPSISGYVCRGWKDGAGSIPSTGDQKSVTFTLNQDSSLTWVYYKPAISIATDGLPSNFEEDDVWAGVRAKFNPALDAQFLPINHSDPFSAPELIKDVRNKCFYRLKEFFGTGSLPQYQKIKTSVPLTTDDIYSFPVEITEDSSIEWVYEKVYELKVTVDPVAIDTAKPKVSDDPNNPGSFVNAADPTYFPENTALTLKTELEVDTNEGRYRCTGASTKSGNTRGGQVLDDGDKKTMSFVLTGNTHVEWVYSQAAEKTMCRPINAPDNLPENWEYGSKITITAGHPADTAANSFFWDDKNKRLYPVRPIPYFEIDWDNGDAIVQGYSDWPASDRTSIVNAPVNLQPSSATLTFWELSFSECYTDAAGTFMAPPELSKDNSSDDKPIFKPSKTGRSVLRFSDSDNEDNPVFVVVDTVALPDNLTEKKKDWSIGTKIADPVHNDPEGRNGYVYFENAYYDGYGPDKAYDRTTREGTILPVNESPQDPDSAQRMVVLWYKTEVNNIGWPVPGLAIEYNCTWPDPPPDDTIIIASRNGKALAEEEYTGQIYYQPDRDAPGYNPNEEHALILGNKVYAIRNDLNNLNNEKTSEPYVLLKYKNSETGLWEMKVFKVRATEIDDEGNGYDFIYSMTAGSPITPLTPLDLLPKQSESCMASGEDWHYRDHKDGHWAKAANWHKDDDPQPQDSDKSKIVMHWYYPLQQGFFYPFKNTDGSLIKQGNPIPFLNGGMSHDDAPHNVTYVVSWPSDVPELHVGETLTEAKYGLPEVKNMAATQVIFDESVYKGEGPLAKLFDPFTERFVDLEKLPDEISTENIGGKQRFPDLPYSLRSRLFYDPLNKKLSFRGVSYDQGIGEALLLLNVMTLREKKRLEDFSPEWTAKIGELFDKTRNPNGISLSGTIRNPYNSGRSHDVEDWDSMWGIMLGLQENDDEDLVPQKLVGLPIALTAGMAAGQGYVVLAENDDDSLGAAPVQLHVIRVADGPYQGEIKVIKSDNVFDEKLTLRHSGDFGGEPEKLHFVWYYKPDNSGLPPLLPKNGTNPDGWRFHKEGSGLNDITIEGAGKMTLSDNWFMVHYYYGDQPGDKYGVAYPALAEDPDPADITDIKDDENNWSKWAGSPGGQTAQLAEGWIKRVVSDLNPLDARVKDFRNYETNTSVSMISQLGPRYEGDIALNGSADNLNNLGLIEAYQTVLDRGKQFSIDQGIDYGPVNNALLNAGTRIADFYTLLGNEAYADALDPTIGFDTRSGELGVMASSIFAFQNQLDSLIEEELVLLRGRDDTMSTTRARPVYNRLLWNFTNGDGELAYVQTYNIFDQDESGIINELDSKVMYPQGHGDAWGNYLTGMTVWYQLLRHQSYTWEPRVESVLVGGAPVPVDYLDERKFAQTASAKAKVGAEIVDLTYRKSYVDDPAGQWQGYKDTDTQRAWGVDGWARRAGQGAYFDWLTANAMLPDQDPNPQHSGITKIDRTTVPELRAIASQYAVIQTQVDKADQGLNPLGLAKGVVPFDINPFLLTPAPTRQTKTHFEQIYDRSLAALENARTVFDYATQYTLMLRGNEDDLTTFRRGIKEQERGYWNRLIESFGYPYDGDIGPGGTYASGYDGPDWIHFMYVDHTDLTGENLYTEQVPYKVEFDFEKEDGDDYEFDDELRYFYKDVSKQVNSSGSKVEITYHINKDVNEDIPWFYKPAGWGKRRAPGEIQMAISGLIQAHASYQRALTELEGQLGVMTASVDILEAKHGVFKHQIEVKDSASGTVKGFNDSIAALGTVQRLLEFGKSLTTSATDAAIQAIPALIGFSNDPGCGIRGLLKGTSTGIVKTLNFATMAIAISEEWLGISKEHTLMARDRKLFIDDARFEVQQMVKELECMESDARAKLQEIYTLREVIHQSLGRYQAALAQGERLLTERELFRKRTAAIVQDYRYQDMGFRIFRNDAVQKYRATFDLAARYAYLAATAYDYETNLLGSDSDSGSIFLTDIVRQRSPGVIMGDKPVVGKRGLADPLARLSQNFDVYKGQLGFNNPQIETNRFSLRRELFRIKDSSDQVWRDELQKWRVDNLLNFPPFKRFCRPFADESMGAQPGIVIPFSSEVSFGYNFFGWPLGGGDSAYDPTNFATKVRSLGVWFSSYNTVDLSSTPRIYLIPVGADVLRSPSEDGFATREWHVVDQKLPAPFSVGESDLSDETWIPVNDTLSGQLSDIRRFSSFRAYPDNPASSEVESIATESTMDSRLIGRSVWNTQWLLIIPGGTLLADPDAGLDAFLNNVSDIKLFFQTYSYSGN